MPPDGAESVEGDLPAGFWQRSSVLSQLTEVPNLDDLGSRMIEAASFGLQVGNHNLEDVLEALPEAVYITDAEGRIIYYNEAAARLWGMRPELGKSEFCGSWKLYWPDGTPLAHSECPMAMALKEKRAIRNVEAIAERPDGVRIPFMPFPTPLFDENGKLTGGVNMLVDLSERAVADETAQRLAAIVESSDDAILAKDLSGTIITWNKGAERLFGYTPEETIGQPILILIPPDRLDEEPKILSRIRNGERIDHYETVRRRKDGSLVDVSLSVSPIRSVEGRIVGASKIARDITERRLADERQQLLLREMNHRVKNLFTLAISLVTLSARSAATPAELATSVAARLEALSRAHALTIPSVFGEMVETEQPTTLHALIRTLVAPFENNPDSSRVRIEGVDVPVSGNAATSLSLLLHEFATNATKYGALSTPKGTIDILCADEGERFVLTWAEHDGPNIQSEPVAEGFGTLLSKATARGQLGGDIEREWRPEGLFLRLSILRQRLAAE
jgi:PAS domain S-box-containing protein